MFKIEFISRWNEQFGISWLALEVYSDKVTWIHLEACLFNFECQIIIGK